jgi:hypothetical protein
VGDVFGRIDAVRRRFVPHPAGLIDVVSAARHSDGLMLVVLDGANRGATESYLLPLLLAALRRSAPITLFHPRALEPSDPYSAHSQIAWPKNLLLAATLVEGPTSLPVSPDIWADSVLVQTDTGEERAGSVLSQVAAAEPTEIDPDSELLAPGKMQDASASEWLEDILKSNALREAADRYERTFRKFQNDPAALQREVVQAVVLPFLASIAGGESRGSAVEEAKKLLGPTIAVGLSEAVDAARRRIA